VFHNLLHLILIGCCCQNIFLLLKAQDCWLRGSGWSCGNQQTVSAMVRTCDDFVASSQVSVRMSQSSVSEVTSTYGSYCWLFSLAFRASWWGWCMSGWKSSTASGTFLQWLAWIQVALSATLTAVWVTSSIWNRPCQRLDFQCFLQSSFTTTQSPGWRGCRGVSAEAEIAAHCLWNGRPVSSQHLANHFLFPRHLCGW